MCNVTGLQKVEILSWHLVELIPRLFSDTVSTA